MKPLSLYAIGRVVFGAAALLAPAATGRVLAGEGGATPDAQAFLRGMGGREIGLGLGILAAIRLDAPIRPWLLAGVLADSGDIAGIAGAWQQMAPDKRALGLAMAGGVATVGAVLLTKHPMTPA